MGLPRDVAKCGVASVLAIVAGSLAISEAPVAAATFTVTNLAPNGPGSLAAAVDQAEANGTIDTIEFAPTITGEIQLIAPLTASSNDLVITGPGSETLTVSHGTGDVFSVSAIELEINGLTLSSGVDGSAWPSQVEIECTASALDSVES